jgi:hypothetical protein
MSTVDSNTKLEILMDPTSTPVVTTPVVTTPVVTTPVVKVPVVKTNSNPTLTDIFNMITTNPFFTEQIVQFINSLNNQDKMTSTTIPKLVLLLIDLVDNTGNFNLSTASLPVLLKMIYEFIVIKYNLIESTDRLVYEEMFVCSVNLLVRIPFKKNSTSLLNRFNCCK